MILGDQAARDRRRVEGNARRLDEGLERGRAIGPPHAAAGDDHGALGPRQELDRLADGFGIAEGARRRAPRRRIDDTFLLHLLAQDVAGQIEIDRTGPARGCLAERRRDHVGDALGVIDALRPLRDGTEDRDLIDLLKGFHPEKDSRARTADGHQRRGVGEGVGDSRQEIRGARARAAHAHARPSRHTRPGVRREGRRLLMPVIDRANTERDAGRLGLEHGPAHQVKERVGTLRAERLRQYFRTRDRGHGRSFPVLGRIRDRKRM